MLMRLREIVRREGNQQGFTLVELLIVLAILAVLAGMAVPKFTGVLAKSKQDAHDANVDMIAHAAELYYDSHNQTRPTMAQLINNREYLKENPKNPIDGTAAAYSIENGEAGNVIVIKPGKCANGVPVEAGTSFSL